MIHAREPLDVTPELAHRHALGQLEQTCRNCGRWEAADWYCSWCASPTGPSDWYANGNVAERAMRLPKEKPDNPPPEYRSITHWPAAWGYCKYRARSRQTPHLASEEA